jgi:hypothetical protein
MKGGIFNAYEEESPEKACCEKADREEKGCQKEASRQEEKVSD